MRLFGFLRRKRADQRVQHHQEIADLGYSLMKRGVLADGRRLHRGYTLVAPAGDVLDNHGMGYKSSYDALVAARRHAAEGKPLDG